MVSLAAIIILLGYDIVLATIQAKPLNLTGNVISLLWFGYQGKIDYTIAIVMGIGVLIGARLAASLVVHKGHRLIKPIFMLVVTIMTIDLFVKNYLI